MCGERDVCLLLLVVDNQLRLQRAYCTRRYGRPGRTKRAYLDLLRDERFGGGTEDDLAGGEPSVEVEHDDGGDEGLTEAGG